MLVTLYRVGFYADEAQQPGHGASDEFAEGLLLIVPGKVRRVKGLQHADGHTCIAAGRIDDKLGRLLEPANAFASLP